MNAYQKLTSQCQDCRRIQSLHRFKPIASSGRENATYVLGERWHTEGDVQREAQWIPTDSHWREMGHALFDDNIWVPIADWQIQIEPNIVHPWIDRIFLPQPSATALLGL